MMKVCKTYPWVILALTCATAFAQSVFVKGTGAGAVHRSGTGAGSVRGVVVATYTNYSDGRFTIWNTNQDVVVDNDSGITWTLNATHGNKDWTNAVDYCDNLTNSTYTDWRLPSLTELSRYVAGGGSTTGLVDSWPSTNNPAIPPGHPFTNVLSLEYWTSTTNGTDYAVTVDMTDGHLDIGRGRTETYYVWPCRGP